MKRNMKRIFTGVLAVCMLMLVNACAEKDLYSPETENPKEIPSEGAVPDFALSSDVALSVNYNQPSYKVHFEVYAENPLVINEETGIRTKVEGLEPIFSAYTDEDCKFEGKMYIPSAVSKVYLYSDYIGISQCVELPIEATGVSYDSSEIKEEVATRATWGGIDYVDYKNEPISISRSLALYSLTGIAKNGNMNSDYVSEISFPKGLLQRVNSRLKGTSTTGHKQNNSKFVTKEEATNIVIVSEEGDKVVESAAVDLVFISERAGYKNVLGYYYYKTGKKPNNVDNLPKYIIFPNTSSEDKGDPLASGSKVRLKFFGENYDEGAQDFKPGYTIGWFMISDGFENDRNDGTIRTKNQKLYSNESWNKVSGEKGVSRCIALYDEASKKTVIGFEDGIGSNHDNSYEDALFYVESDPIYAIEIPPERPEIPDPEPQPDETLSTYGTFAFEDQWPNEGDYDMNDAAIKYVSSVTYNSKNEVVKMEISFAPKQANNAATYNNAFGFQLLRCSESDFTVEEGAALEGNQDHPTFIVFNNLNREKETKKITLNFRKESKVDKRYVVISEYNPFVVANADVQLGAGRNEVHLPKYSPTSLGQQVSDKGWGSYYVSEEEQDGIRFPFAINIPGKQDFRLAAERIRIDLAYDKFKSWVEKGCGAADADWYKFPVDGKVQ